MTRIKKLSIGIRPSSKMFRMTSLSGLIIDEILSERESNKHLDGSYYTQIAKNNEAGSYKMYNEKLGNVLILDLNNIVFTKDNYKNTKPINFDKFLLEFKQIWNVLNNVLNLRDTRRIGIVAEYQFEADKTNINKQLIESLTTLTEIKHPAKFFLRFENRHPTEEGIAPDIKKSDFVNVIKDFYDSEIDSENPKKGAFNANIDVQRYFSPLLKTKVFDEVKKLSNTFRTESENFETFLKDKGLID